MSFGVLKMFWKTLIDSNFTIVTSIVESLEGVTVGNADNHKFSFVASLQSRRGEHLCSGTLITNTHVVTAAYCLEGEHPRGVLVVLGVADLRNAPTVRYNVASWTTYEEWINQIQLQRPSYDIAIVRVSFIFLFAKFESCLPNFW